MRQKLKRTCFRLLYSRLGRAAKIKLLDTICSEFQLNVICDYSREKLPLVVPNDGILKSLTQSHEYHGQAVLDYLIQQVPPDAVCFDIGANIGFWAVPLGLRVQSGDGRVYAFEPTPASRRLLQMNLNLNQVGPRNVHVLECAVGEKPGTARLACFEGPYQSAGWNTLGNPSGLSDGARGSVRTIEVSVRALDDVWSEMSRPNVEFVKIDVEGSEARVLAGGREFFTAHSQRASFVGFMEVNRRALAACGSSVDELVSCARQLGLKFASIEMIGETLHAAPLSDSAVMSMENGDVLLLPSGSPLLG